MTFMNGHYVAPVVQITLNHSPRVGVIFKTFQVRKMWLFAWFIHAYQGSRAKTWTQNRVPPNMSTSLFLVMYCAMYQGISQSEHA